MSLGSKVGELKCISYATPDDGWLICDGSAVSRTTYAALFAKIGTTYGAGNNSTTFNLPNLSGRFPLGKSASHALGTTGGAETVTLTEQQIPAHSHTITVAGGGDSSGSTARYNSTNTNPKTYTSSSYGGGKAHNNMPPYLTVNWEIKY